VPSLLKRIWATPEPPVSVAASVSATAVEVVTEAPPLILTLVPAGAVMSSEMPWLTTVETFPAVSMNLA
jgi:hypothetical protein